MINIYGISAQLSCFFKNELNIYVSLFNIVGFVYFLFGVQAVIVEGEKTTKHVGTELWH